MPNIKKIELDSKKITGLYTRTRSIDEMNVDTQKIAPLWDKYFSEILPTLNENRSVYGVYYNYQSDSHGEFDVLVGSEQEEEQLESVVLKEGKYLQFSAKGEMPQAIIETWKQVWGYFEDPSIDEKRAYLTDFDHYTGVDTAEIYIGVHYF